MIKQWIKRTTPLILTILGMLLITACGGGGGSDSASTTGSGFLPPPDPPPVEAPQGATIDITLTDIDFQPCDHRTVDGATGAHFLQSLRLYIENPIRLLIS